MLNLLIRIYRRIAAVVSGHSALTENGERVDINLKSKPRYALTDTSQKSHYKRYVFARQFVRPGMACGDFACGSGYDSALLAETTRKVTAIDIKQHVIDRVTGRYAGSHHVESVVTCARSPTTRNLI